MKVLIVEDEEHIAKGLRFNLEAEGYDVVLAGDGAAALRLAAADKFDSIVLDVMLPGMNGFEVARTLRQREDFTPILMLTARGRPEDVLRGFEAGTDDYLPKPFDLNVFLARLKGLIRRRGWSQRESQARPPAGPVTVNGREIDFDALEIRGGRGRQAVHLTLMEAKLLRYLIDNEGRAVSRSEILGRVWDLQADTDTRAIDNFIVRLRKYIEDTPDDPKILQTVRGVGYKFLRPAE